MSTPDELERLARAATPGPWRSVIDDTGGQWSGWPLCIVPENDDDRSVVRTGGLWPYEWDAKVSQHEAVSTAAFIAAANPATILALLSERAELLAAVEKMREIMSRLVALPVAERQLVYLDKGIGTKTPDGVWLEARAALNQKGDER